MIKQGSNEPISITFDVIPVDISVTLSNEIRIMKHWNKSDLQVSEDGLVYKATYSQEESLEWDEGPCEIQVRWVDGSGDREGTVQHTVLREVIEHSPDTTILETGDYMAQIHAKSSGKGAYINATGKEYVPDSTKAPYIDKTTGTWWQWDRNARTYVDTGISPYGIKGDQGEPGEQGPRGLTGPQGTGVYTYDVDESDVDGGTNTIFFTDGSVMHVKNGNRGSKGEKGDKGDRGEKGERGDAGVIDQQMSGTSPNAVANRIIKQYVDSEVEKAKDTAKADLQNLTDDLGDLAYKDGAGGTYTPSGTLNMDSYTPEGSVSAPTISVSESKETIIPFGSAGTLPELTMYVDENDYLHIDFAPGTLPSAGTSKNVLIGVSASASQPSFSGTGKAPTGAFSGTEGQITVS